MAAEIPAWARRVLLEGVPSAEFALWRCEQGDGPKRAVLLHGIGGTHRYWTAVAAPSLSGYRLVLVDLLGFGSSPRPWMRYTTQLHLAALHRTLASDPRPLTLIGHSLGAVLALGYAAQYPADVEALVLISLPDFGGLAGAQKWFSGRPGSWLYTNAWAMALACILTRRIAGRLLPHLIHTIPRELVEDMVKHNMASWTTTLWDVLYRQDVESLARAVDPALPILLVHGDADRTAPLERVKKLAHGRPTWRLHVLHGVDHHPFLRQRQECDRIIQGWLDARA